jgi:DNA end-binding protein Ku
MGVPGEAKGRLAPTERELQMAEQLIEDMSAEWDPTQYEDHTREEIMALVQQKMDKGEVKRVEQPAAAAEGDGGAEIIDLTELLKRSLRGGDTAAPARRAGAAKAAPTERAAAKGETRGETRGEGKAAKPVKPAAKAAKTARPAARKRA